MRDVERRAAVCQILLSTIGRAFLWEDGSPGDDARRLVSEPSAPINPSDRVVLGLALYMAGISADLDMGDLFMMDPEHLELVGSLLIALAGGDTTVDDWIRQNIPTHETGHAYGEE